jgi:hypothetical protein
VESTKLVTIGLPKILQEIVFQSFSARGSIKILGHYSAMEDYLKYSSASQSAGRIQSSNDAYFGAESGGEDSAMTVDTTDGAINEPQVILLQTEAANRCPLLLYKFPSARVVSLEDYGKYIVVWKLTPERKILGQVSSDELADYIFSAVNDVMD